MSWKNATFINPAPAAERTVGGETVQFWPISSATLFELRHIGGSLAKGLTLLFSYYGPAPASAIYTHWDPENPSQPLLQEAMTAPVEPELVAQLSKQRENALNELISSLTDDATLVVIGRLISDSARELFPKRPQRGELLEFMNAVSMENTVELLLGVVDANRKLFDPLLEGLTPMLSAAKESVEAKVKAARTMELVPEEKATKEAGSPSSTDPTGTI